MKTAPLTIAHIRLLAFGLKNLSRDNRLPDDAILADIWPQSRLRLPQRVEGRGADHPGIRLVSPVLQIVGDPGMGKSATANLLAQTWHGPVIRANQVHAMPELEPETLMIVDEVYDAGQAHIVDLINTFRHRAPNGCNLIVVAYKPWLGLAPTAIAKTIECREDGITLAVNEMGLIRKGHIGTDHKMHPEDQPLSGELRLDDQAAERLRSAMKEARLGYCESLDLASRLAGYASWHALNGHHANLKRQAAE